MNQKLHLISLFALFIYIASTPAFAQQESGSEKEQEETTSEELTLESLAGTWKVKTVEVQGKTMEPQGGMPEELQIEENRLSGTVANEKMEGFSGMTLVLDASTDPMQLDFVREKNGRKESLPGIVKKDGDTLKLALPLVPVEMEPGERLQRPESFDTKTGMFMVLTATLQDDD